MRLPLISLFLVVLALPLGATPVILGLDPMEGFSYAPTHVTITGTGFTDGPVTVLFDDVPATLLQVTPTTLRVLAHSAAAGGREGTADLTVRVAGQGEAKFLNAIYFHALAQASPEDYTAVLVPLTALATPGAHGSIWESELRIFNASPIPLRMPGPETFIVELPVDPAVLIAPHRTDRVFLNRRQAGVDGHFLYVPNPLLYAPKMSLRVRDTSQNATSLGDEVPVVRSDQFAGDLAIVDVPVDPKYRATLRIYALTAAPMSVGVVIYPESGDTPYAQFDIPLNGIVTIDHVPFPPHPAYAAFDPLVPAVRAAGGRVRIEITNYNINLSPPPPTIWAFLSLTNNETNQVTIVTPK